MHSMCSLLTLVHWLQWGRAEAVLERRVGSENGSTWTLILSWETVLWQLNSLTSSAKIFLLEVVAVCKFLSEQVACSHANSDTNTCCITVFWYCQHEQASRQQSLGSTALQQYWEKIPVHMAGLARVGPINLDCPKKRDTKKERKIGGLMSCITKIN